MHPILGRRFLVTSGLLAAGGQGSVYRATDREAASPSERVVAVKIMDLNDTVMKHRLRREYRLLQEHPHENVVPVIEFGEETDGTMWYAMPLARTSLEVRLASAVYGMNETLEVVKQVGAGVAHLHSRGVIHRDIKPGNILEIRPSWWVVSDLGYATRLSDSTRVTETGEGFGTEWYTPPEQWSDAHDVDERADIYALARVAQHMLVGYRSNVGEIGHPPVEAVLRRATSAEPGARQSSVVRFIQDLEAAALSPATWSPATPWEEERERLLRLIQSPVENAHLIGELAALLEEAKDDTELMGRAEEVVVYLPTNIIAALWKRDPGGFRQWFGSYVKHVDATTNYEFSFTDRVADFLDLCVGATEDPRVLALVLPTLASLGARHNRWHVRDVFVRVLQSLTDQDAVAYAMEAIGGISPQDAAWNAAELDTGTLHPLIRSALAKAIAGP